jgi:hypothetical protein
MKGYTCRVCGEYHDTMPLSYVADAPALWYTIPEQEREARAALTTDTCIIDDQHFFVLGNVELPIVDSDQVFLWTVWVSLSQGNYERTLALWEQSGRESEPHYFGWISTSLPVYPETLNLKTHVHTRSVGQRPLIELEPSEHPLAVDQRQGITWERVQEFAETLLHG